MRQFTSCLKCAWVVLCLYTSVCRCPYTTIHVTVSVNTVYTTFYEYCTVCVHNCMQLYVQNIMCSLCCTYVVHNYAQVSLYNIVCVLHLVKQNYSGFHDFVLYCVWINCMKWRCLYITRQFVFVFYCFFTQCVPVSVHKCVTLSFQMVCFLMYPYKNWWMRQHLGIVLFRCT